MKSVVIGLVMGIVIIALVGGGYFVYTKKISPKSNSVTKIAESLEKNPIIAKVGEEAIYQSDLNEAKKYVATGNKTDEQLVDKIMEDSVLLQEGRTMVQLTSEIYSSPNKNYAKRLEAVKKVKDFYLEEKNGVAKKVSGSLISVWADNFTKEPFDLEENKKTALAKLTSVWEKVKAKQLTLEEAANTIANDPDQGSIDSSYKKNALTPFVMDDPKETIVKNSEINPMIWNLKQGETTPIVYIEISPREKFYAFAKATKVENTSDTMAYDAWFAEVKKKYKFEKI